VANWGFTPCALEGMSFKEQILLFQHAEFVIAPHGAGLSNLLFCPGTAKVIELMPEMEMRPFFWLLASKLGLMHGLLACAAVGAGNDPTPFNRRMHVDTDRLATLFRILEARRPS
ncbi:MAG: glycosyltransferase family 61 protein, partial [Acidisphaera sp.]|nr:glycosyltransferase family 61 protein [Acidisphaera sp.]